MEQEQVEVHQGPEVPKAEPHEDTGESNQNDHTYALVHMWLL